MALLEVKDIHTYYGNIEALKGISLEVEEGECVTLIGSNGAGKSTTLRSISGLTPPRQGSIRFTDREIARRRRRTSCRWDVAQSPEGRHVFSRMTVHENLDARRLPASRPLRDHVGPRARVRAVPAPQGARAPEGRNDVGRRAADAGDRARADGEAEAPAARRAVDGHRARSSSSASTRRSPRSTARARRSCSWSRTRTSRSTCQPAATCSRPARWRCTTSRPPCARTPRSSERTWGRDADLPRSHRTGSPLAHLRVAGLGDHRLAVLLAERATARRPAS